MGEYSKGKATRSVRLRYVNWRFKKRQQEHMVQTVRENLRIAQARQKSYADGKWRDLTFSVDDYVYLKVSPMRGIRRFNVKGKLAPRYIRPFKVLERKGEVAYRL